MIGYVTFGTNDLAQAASFYDRVLGTADINRVMEQEGRFVAWGRDMESPGIAATIPFDGQPATRGNGTMVALTMNSRAEVDAMHAMALSLGGKDEGAPGIRDEAGPDWYAAYFRDLDGNKLCAFHNSPSAGN